MDRKYYSEKNMTWWEMNGGIIWIFAIVFGFTGACVGGVLIFNELTGNGIEAQEEEMRIYRQEKLAITNMINDGKLTCGYIGDLRMKYAGEGITVLDSNFIQKKLMTYWNVNSCGVEWNWYND